jgi:hypothetical protein
LACTLTLPERSLCGSSPHVSCVVTPGQSAMHVISLSGGEHTPSPQQLLCFSTVHMFVIAM